MADFNINLPQVNGRPVVGISVGIDVPAYTDLMIPILNGRDVTNENAASYAARWAYGMCIDGSRQINDAYFPAAVYSIVKYGLIGYIENDEIDGKWVFVERADPVVSARVPILNEDSVRRMLTIILATKISYWSTNHHIGQEARGGYLKKVLAQYNILEAGESIITAIHTAAHLAGTIRILRNMGIEGLRDTRDISINYPINFRLSDDFNLRVTGFPSGVGKLSLARAILQRMIKHPAFRIVPDARDFIELIQVYADVLANRSRFHIGSAYLTGEPRLDTADVIQTTTLGRLGSFASVFYKDTTLFKSPSISGVEGNKFKSYEDFDSEFLKTLTELKKTKTADNVLAMVRSAVEVIDEGTIQQIADALRRNPYGERSGRGVGAVVSMPVNDPSTVI